MTAKKWWASANIGVGQKKTRKVADLIGKEVAQALWLTRR
jgi:hypothetical protein